MVRVRGSGQAGNERMTRARAKSLWCGMAGFAELVVWREAAALAANVEEAVERLRGPAAASVADQMVRAANSIHANIAEGHGRGVTLDCVRFLRVAMASADELESHLRVARLRRRLPEVTLDAIIDHTRRVRFLIHRFLESVERRRKR